MQEFELYNDVLHTRLDNAIIYTRCIPYGNLKFLVYKCNRICLVNGLSSNQVSAV